MPNSIRHDFHSELATTILNEIQYKRANFYYFLGKVETWGIGDTRPEIMEIDSEYENMLIRSNAIFMKKITPNDISIVTTRYDWATGTTYTGWNHTIDMSLYAFYCLTTDNNVYKCLDNGGGVPSTVKPTGKSFSVLRTADGYLWKYMYTVPTFKRTRFTSLIHLPVQRSLTDSFYNKGSIDAVVVTNAGSGYSDALSTTVSIVGTTTGSDAIGTLICGSIGEITGVSITNGGTGYTSGVDLTFTSSGINGKGTAIVSGGIITGMTIVTPGTNYITGDAIVFTVGGAIIVPSVSRVTGEIKSLKIVYGGAGYVSTPTLTVVGVGGTGIYGNVTALASCVLFNGKIVLTNIQDPGINYPTDNATSIVVQGDGVGASFSPVIYNGELFDVVIENSGTGYTSINLTVAGTGINGDINAIISSSDFLSEQSIVEQTTVPGAIYAIHVTTEGTVYTDATIVTVNGDGIGCTAHAMIVNGAVHHIVVDTYGSDYTYGTITIFDPTRSILGIAIEAVAYPIIPMVKGHGYDAVNELFGNTLAINTSLRQDQNLNILLQDYRQFGMIKNPTNILTGKLFNLDSTILAYEALFSSVVGLLVDEILVLGSNKFRVILINGNHVLLQRKGIKYIDPVGLMVAEIEPTRTYTSTNIVSSPIANKYSGNLLYASDENPFMFNQEQGIIIKTFLKF